MEIDRKAQIGILLQPRFLIIIVCILLGYTFAPNLNIGREFGVLLGMVIGFLISRYL